MDDCLAEHLRRFRLPRGTEARVPLFWPSVVCVADGYN